MTIDSVKAVAQRVVTLTISVLLVAGAGPQLTADRAPPTRSWFWCGVQGATATAYVTDVKSRTTMTKFRIKSLGFQFLETINTTFGEHLDGNRGLCRSFSSVTRAQSELSNFRNRLQHGGQDIVVVGIY